MLHTHTQLFHSQPFTHNSFTHNFVTHTHNHNLSHTALSQTTLSYNSFTHNFVTNNLSHKTLSLTTLSLTQSFTHSFVRNNFVIHNSFTHNFVTNNFSHTTLSLTTLSLTSLSLTTFHTQLFHTQLCHTQLFTYNFSNDRPASTISFFLSSFSVPLQPLFLIIGRSSWLVGLSGPGAIHRPRKETGPCEGNTPWWFHDAEWKSWNKQISRMCMLWRFWMWMLNALPKASAGENCEHWKTIQLAVLEEGDVWAWEQAEQSRTDLSWKALKVSWRAPHGPSMSSVALGGCNATTKPGHKQKAKGQN